MISMSPIRFALCATIVALLFLSSAYGEELTVSVSEGSDANSITSTSNFGAAANNAVEQAITLNPKEDTAKNHMYVEGPYSTTRTASGTNGGFCYSGFAVTGVNAKSYYDFLADGSYYAQLSEWLQASGADSINAYGYAFHNNGYAANSLYATSDWGLAQASYFNYAYATPSYAYDYAVVGSASGNFASVSSIATNNDWKDYASTNFYAASAPSSYVPAMIWNVAQNANSAYTYASAQTTSGNSWSSNGYVAQTSYAKDYFGDYSYNSMYSPNGLTWATSSYYSDYAYSSGYNRNTWASQSSWLFGSQTDLFAENSNSYTGVYSWALDTYYDWNKLSQYAYNSYGSSDAVNFTYV
jgi:hypothetical protein